MREQASDKDQQTLWTPLYRTELEALLEKQEYTTLHLYGLFWLIWLPLLSAEELVLLLSLEETTHVLVKTKKHLSEQISQMTRLHLIDTITIQEPGIGRHQRYYITDLGLYLYLSIVHPTPPLTPAQLASAYPVKRDDLLARLARPSVHLALAALSSRLIVEGDPLGFHLVSWQQFWRLTMPGFVQKQHMLLDAALLIGEGETKYAFLVHIDPGHRLKPEKEEKKFLWQLLDWRQLCLLHRQSWPALLIMTVPERLASWGKLLQESSQNRLTKPLAGGVTLIQDIRSGVYA